MAATSPAPEIEVIVRSPVGTVRAWLDDDGAIRTSIVAELGVEASDRAAVDVTAVLDKAAAATRGVVGAVRRLEPKQPWSPTLQLWIAERCVLDPQARVRSTALYEDFVAWCDRQDLRAPSRRMFGDMLNDRQIGSCGKDGLGMKLRLGLALKPNGEPKLAAVG